MRKWANLVAPNDPGAWYDVDGVYPTSRGTYKTTAFPVGATNAASGAGTVVYAFAANTVASTVEWVVDSARIWSYVAGLNDKTGAVTIGSYPHMAQYGNITVCAMGVGAATVVSTSGGTFAALAGAPNAEIAVVQSNCVLLFNTATSADGWAASDVGDHTNWTTGEAASGRLIQTPGPITAAVAFQDVVIVFKANSVYRMRYVGGTVKWTAEVIHQFAGCGTSLSVADKYMACAGPHGVLFAGMGDQFTASGTNIWLMDGAAQFDVVNRDTALTSTLGGISYFRYIHDYELFTMWAGSANQCWFYSPQSGMWGKATPHGAAGTAKPVMGGANILQTRSVIPTSYYKSATDVITRYQAVVAPVASSCYLQTSMVGTPDQKTLFERVTPLLRLRTDLGSDSAALEVKTYRELQDTSADRTLTIAESSPRKRFDFQATDCFARFKVTFTALTVEVDDFLIRAKSAGTD